MAWSEDELARQLCPRSGRAQVTRNSRKVAEAVFIRVGLRRRLGDAPSFPTAPQRWVYRDALDFAELGIAITGAGSARARHRRRVRRRAVQPQVPFRRAAPDGHARSGAHVQFGPRRSSEDLYMFATDSGMTCINAKEVADMVVTVVVRAARTVARGPAHLSFGVTTLSPIVLGPSVGGR